MNTTFNNGRKSAILNLIKLKFFRAYPSLKPHVSHYRNGLAIRHSFPDIKKIIADSLIRAISKIDMVQILERYIENC